MTFETSQLYSAFSEAWDNIRVADFRCGCFRWVNWSLSACYVPQELATRKRGTGWGWGLLLLDAAECLSMHRTDPTARNCAAQYASSAKAENPWLSAWCE